MVSIFQCWSCLHIISTVKCLEIWIKPNSVLEWGGSSFSGHRKCAVLVFRSTSWVCSRNHLHCLYILYICVYFIPPGSYWLFYSNWRSITASHKPAKRFMMSNYRFQSIYLINRMLCSFYFMQPCNRHSWGSFQMVHVSASSQLPTHLNQSVMSAKYLIQVCWEQKHGPSGTAPRTRLENTTIFRKIPAAGTCPDGL